MCVCVCLSVCVFVCLSVCVCVCVCVCVDKLSIFYIHMVSYEALDFRFLLNLQMVDSVLRGKLHFNVPNPGSL